MSQPHWVCPGSWRVCFPCLHCLGSRLLCLELSEAGPELYALPRSKPLRFRFSGTPQRRRLGWACILCPSQVRAAQVTQFLVSAVTVTYHLPRPSHSVFWVYNGHAFSGVPCVSSGELISGCDPPDVDCPESQKYWLATKSASVWYRMLLWGPRLPSSGCPPLPVFSGGWAGPQPASSAQSFVL